MYEIVVIKNGTEQGRLEVSAPISIIGRADTSQIVLAEDSVSRRHARLLLEDNRLYIEDLQSGNGTYVNHERIHARTELKGGDEIQITPFTLSVEAHIDDDILAAPVPQDAATVVIPAVDPRQASPAAPPPPPAEAKMILRRGEAGKSSYTLTNAPMTIGRSEDRDIILTDPASSRRHAVIEFQDGKYIIRDEGSANGLTINGLNVRHAELHHGDLVVIGETEFEFVWPGDPGHGRVGGEGSTLPPTGAQPVDPYSETGIMPAYGNWPGQATGPRPGAPEMGYTGTQYSPELGGSAPKKKRSVLFRVMVAVVILLGAAIAWKTMRQAPPSQEAAAPAGGFYDPCANVGDTCPDPTDEQCRQCLNIRARINRGQELFAQKEFGQAVAEFQRVLDELDPGNEEARRYRYISYEFWTLSTVEEALQSQVQTLAQKMDKLRSDFEEAKALVTRYAKRYPVDTSERTLSTVRSRLNSAISKLRKVQKAAMDDAIQGSKVAAPEAEKIKKEAQSLQSQAAVALRRITKIKQEAAEQSFEQSIQAIYEEGKMLKASGGLAKAQAKFQEVIAKDPTEKTAYVSLARQEIKSIDRILKDRAKPLLKDAIKKMRNKQYIEARSKLQEALRIDPNLTEARERLENVNRELEQHARQLYSEAKVQFNVEQYRKAEKLLRQVLALVPDKNNEVHKNAVKMLKQIDKM